MTIEIPATLSKHQRLHVALTIGSTTATEKHKYENKVSAILCYC